MSKSEQSGKWFGPREGGVGLPDPICWQGWLVYAIAILLFLGGTIPISLTKPAWLFAYIPVVLIPFALICRLKGPSLKHWSSGSESED